MTEQERRSLAEWTRLIGQLSEAEKLAVAGYVQELKREAVKV